MVTRYGEQGAARGSLNARSPHGTWVNLAPTVVKFLLGTDISRASITIAPMAGFGLLLSGIVCWPRVGPIVPRLRVMLIFSVLVATYLEYLCFGAESVGRLFAAGHCRAHRAGYSLYRRVVQAP